MSYKKKEENKKVKVSLDELDKTWHDFKDLYYQLMTIGKKLMDDFNLLMSHMEEGNEK